MPVRILVRSRTCSSTTLILTSTLAPVHSQVRFPAPLTSLSHLIWILLRAASQAIQRSRRSSLEGGARYVCPSSLVSMLHL